MRPQWKIHRTKIVLLCAVAASGCDSRDLLGPAVRTVAPRAYVDAPQSLGTSFVPAPANSGPAAVSSAPYANLTPFPGSTWVVVNVTGNVKLTWNEAQCAQRLVEAPFFPCQTGSPLSAFGPDPWDSGPLQVYAIYANGSSGAVRLRASGGSGEGGGSGVGLYYAERPGSLVGHVNMTAVWAWDPSFGNGPYSWDVTGGYTVTATAVPAPFQVAESAPDADGTVTYSVEPLYDLRFSSPVAGWPAGATFWAFYPGDSLPDQPDHSWPGWQITECQFKLVCQWKPPVPGRMQVLAHLEGQSADVRSKKAECQNSTQALRSNVTGASSCDQEPKLSLKCNRQSDSVSVERGSNVECVAELTPPGNSALRVTSWSFNGLRRTDGDTTASAWAGPMVESGTVRIRGQWGEQQGEAAVKIGVVPRVWPDLQITRVELRKEVEPRSMANYAPAGRAFGRHIRGELALDSMTHRSAATGPNAGYFYVGAPVRILASTVWVHPALYLLHSLPDSVGPSSPGYSDWRRFYDDQNGVGSGTCDHAGLARFRDNVEHHEGLTLADDSHVGVANGSFRADSLQVRFERQFSLSDSSDVEFRVAVVMDSFTNNTSNYHWLQVHFDSIDTHNVYNVGCSLDYNRSDP